MMLVMIMVWVEIEPFMCHFKKWINTYNNKWSNAIYDCDSSSITLKCCLIYAWIALLPSHQIWYLDPHMHRKIQIYGKKISELNSENKSKFLKRQDFMHHIYGRQQC